MLKNNRIAFALALVMAIALWAYVLGEVDPVRTVTIRDIPIRLVDQSALEDDNLIITEMDHDKISVTFTAKRSLLTKIDADDFHATADLRDVKLGNNVIQVNLTKPSNVNLESYSPEYINITTEQYVTVEKNIEVSIINPTDDESEPIIINVSEDVVGVSGASSDVGRVVKVIAELDVSRMEKEPKSISAELRPVDENGETVEGVALAFNNVTITASMKSSRELPLNVTVTGVEGGSVYRSYTVPESVIVKGDEEILSGLDSIECEPIDLTDCYESSEIPLSLNLPEGVELVTDAGTLVLTVTVENAETATFDFDETDINVTGVGTGRAVRITNVNISVTVKGLSAIVGALTEKNFTLTADIKDLEAGTNSVDLVVTCDQEGVDSITATPDKVEILIEELE